MKQIIALLICFIFFAACSKKSSVENDIPANIPAWLQTQIAEIQKREDGKLYTVSEYRIDGVVFYSITLPIDSAALGRLFDVKGVRANLAWESILEAKKVRVIWPVNP